MNKLTHEIKVLTQNVDIKQKDMIDIKADKQSLMADIDFYQVKNLFFLFAFVILTIIFKF